jgi:starch phosphorylase
MTADEVVARRRLPDHARLAIEASPLLKDVLQLIAEGRFSPDDPDRYHGIVDRLWHHDYFLVASDFDAYAAAQRQVAAAWHDRAGWHRMAALNTARVGFFSSDRTIRGYMTDIWGAKPAL